MDVVEHKWETGDHRLLPEILATRLTCWDASCPETPLLDCLRCSPPSCLDNSRANMRGAAVALVALECAAFSHAARPRGVGPDCTSNKSILVSFLAIELLN